MRATCRGRNVLLTERMFQGDLGAKLYVGTNGPASILFRPNRCFNPLKQPLTIVMTRDVSVDAVKSPVTQLTYNLPAALLDADVWYQVRTHASDVENETIYRPRRLRTDGSGDTVQTVVGFAAIDKLEKRDGGVVRVYFTYTARRDGIQPLQFRLVQTAGAVALADVVVEYTIPGQYTADIEGLSDGDTATLRLDAENDPVVTTLVTGINITADAAGPPVVSSAVAVEAA